MRGGSSVSLPRLLARLAMFVSAVVLAGPELPEYETPGERPPNVMKMYFGACQFRVSSSTLLNALR